jgi:hypothetical protein
MGDSRRTPSSLRPRYLINTVNKANRVVLEVRDAPVYYGLNGVQGRLVVGCQSRSEGDHKAALAEVRDVAKKKSTGAPKRYGTLVRVSDEFAKALSEVTRFEGSSVAEFADAHLLPVVRKRYRDAVLKEARRMEGSEK